MARADCLTGDNLFALLNQARRRVSSRKLRLFACACCRRVWHLIGDDRSRRPVEVVYHEASRTGVRP